MRPDRKILIFLTVLAIAILSGLYLLFNKLANKLETIIKEKEKIIIAIISIIIITILSISACLLKNYGRTLENVERKKDWDLKIVYGYVYSYINNSKFETDEEKNYIDYIKMYNNANGAIITLIPIYKVFKLFGNNDVLLPGIVQNVIFIYISLIGIYLIARKLYDKSKAIFILLFSIFIVSPIYLYASIFYSDTLSIPFIIFNTVIYVYFRNDEKKMNIGIILISILTFIGYLIKATAIFISLAIIIDMIIHYKSKSISKILIFLCCFIIQLVIYKNLIVPKVFDFDIEENKMPFTHFIMMGLKQKYKYYWEEGEHRYLVYGVWDVEDVFLTTFSTDKYIDIKFDDYGESEYFTMLSNSPNSYDQKKKINIDEIKNRLKEYGFTGLIKFLYKKANETWADGTCYVSTKLNRGYIYENPLGELVRTEGKNFKLYFYFALSMHLAMIFFIVLGSLDSIFRNTNEEIWFIKLAILMLMALLIIWETRSRYILNYLLLLYINVIPGFDFTLRNIKKRKLSSKHRQDTINPHKVIENKEN